MNYTKAVILTVLLILFLPVIAFAQPLTIDGVIELANEELNMVYYVKDQLDQSLWDKYGILAKPTDNPGSPHIRYHEGPQYQVPRYIGKTIEGADFPNPDFPIEYPITSDMNKFNWIESPWDKGLTNNNDFHGNTELIAQLEEMIVAGVNNNESYNIDIDNRDWTKYAAIHQPPTEYTPGFGQMWHRLSNGSIRYITFIIPARIQLMSIPVVDLEANINQGETQLKPGESTTIGGVLTNNFEEDIQTDYVWRVNNEESEPIAITLPANSEVTVTKEYTAPNVTQKTDVVIELEVNPDKDKPEDEPDYENNKDILNIEIIPNQVDLVASFVTRTEEAVPNKNLTYKAKLINPSGTEQNTDYVWRIDGKTYGPYKITLAPNSSQIVTRSIKTTQGFHEIEVEVNPSQNKPANEVRYCNNKDFVYLIVNYPDLPEAEPGSGLRPPGLAG